MADVHTREQRSYNMSRVKGKNTGLELKFRKKLFIKGCRGYRLNYKLPGNPDLVFPKKKVSVFIDGCFWHKCPKCFKSPKSNKAFWKSKIEGNVERDKKANASLKKSGWKVIRIWEHDMRKDINKSCQKVIKALSG
jgi:DNA mismatch endonuclease (patch repair protein)